jgi:hypothetical protein
MYFVVRGTVEIVSEDGSIVHDIVSDGGFFGELGVLKGVRRTASVRVATTACETIVVEAKAIQTVFNEYPDVYHLVALEAEQRFRMVQARQVTPSCEVALSAPKKEECVSTPRSQRRVLGPFGKPKQKDDASPSNSQDAAKKSRRSNSFGQLFKRRGSTTDSTATVSSSKDDFVSSDASLDQTSKPIDPSKLQKRHSDVQTAEEFGSRDSVADPPVSNSRKNSTKDIMIAAAENVSNAVEKVFIMETTFSWMFKLITIYSNRVNLDE